MKEVGHRIKTFMEDDHMTLAYVMNGYLKNGILYNETVEWLSWGIKGGEKPSAEIQIKAYERQSFWARLKEEWYEAAKRRVGKEACAL